MSRGRGRDVGHDDASKKTSGKAQRAGRGKGRSAGGDPIEFGQGRRNPFSQLGDWVALADIRHPSVRLYWVMAAHRNRQRADNMVWPSLNTLATMLGYTEGKKLWPYLQELVDIGAIEILERDPSKGRMRNLYLIHDDPPDGYEGFQSVDDFHVQARAQRTARRAEQQADQVREALFDADASRDGAEMSPMNNTRDQSCAGGAHGAQMSPTDGAHFGPTDGAHLSPQTRSSNQTKNQSGGAYRLPPAPPAVVTAGHDRELVTSELGFTGDQLTACAEPGVGDFATAPNEESSVSEWDYWAQDAALDASLTDSDPTTLPCPTLPPRHLAGRTAEPAAIIDDPALPPSVPAGATESVNDTHVTPRPLELSVIESGAVSRSCAAPSVQAPGGRPSLRTLKAQFDAEKAAAISPAG
ncbi:hypothetical protein [Nocardia vaccinii]|uniref:hypothetical protein n=1 Tax=Nocardia vaccinii TaxID=1822 RepID=UPI0008372239|nr:hypothetical protein [Nocardia vaccinii]